MINTTTTLSNIATLSNNIGLIRKTCTQSDSATGTTTEFNVPYSEDVAKVASAITTNEDLILIKMLSTVPTNAVLYTTNVIESLTTAVSKLLTAQKPLQLNILLSNNTWTALVTSTLTEYIDPTISYHLCLQGVVGKVYYDNVAQSLVKYPNDSSVTITLITDCFRQPSSIMLHDDAFFILAPNFAEYNSTQVLNGDTLHCSITISEANLNSGLRLNG